MRRRMLGAIGGVKSAPTARDYVQDGLVGLWDGIENAGFGVHNAVDADYSSWTDLSSSNRDLTIRMDWWGTKTSGWVDDGLKVYGSSGSGVAYYSSSEEGVKTIEAVFTTFDLSKNMILFSNGGRTSVEARRGILVSTVGVGGLTSGYYSCQPATLVGKKAAVSIYQEVSSRVVSKIFFNGINETVSTSSSYGGYNAGEAKISIGCRYGSTPTYFNGVVHCVRIYNRELTSAETIKNYAVDKARFGLA